MSGRYKLRKAIDVAQIVKQDVQEEIPAVLGVTKSGKKMVEIPERPGYVYAAIRGNLSELVAAYNDQVSPVYGLHVLLIRDRVDKGRFRVRGRDLGKYQSWGATSYLPKHGAQHSFNPDTPGGDITWIWGKQFMPLMAVPSGSNGGPNVVIYGSPYNLNGNWLFSGDTGTVNILPDFKPTGAWARMVLVFVDEFGNPQVTGSSDYFSTTLTGTSDITPYVPEIDTQANLPIAAIRLVSGTSIINWNNIYDFRPHFRLSSDAGHIIQDDGVSQTQRDYLNFVGAGFVVYDDAGKTNVSGTASGGGGTYTPNRVVYSGDDGIATVNNYFRYDHDTNVDNLLIGGLGAITAWEQYYNFCSVMDYGGNGSWNDCFGAFAFEETPAMHFFRAGNSEAEPHVVDNGDVTAEMLFYHYGTGSLYCTYGSAAYMKVKALGSQVDAFGSEIFFGATVSGTATSREAMKLWAEQAWFYKDVIARNSGAYYWGDPGVTGSWRSLRANDRVEFQENIAGNWTTMGWSYTGTSHISNYVYTDFVTTGTTTAGMDRTRTTGGSYTNIGSVLTLFNPIKLEQVLWDIKNTGSYTLQILTPLGAEQFLSFPAVYVDTASTADVVFTPTGTNNILMPGEYYFKMTGDRTMTWDDSETNSESYLSTYDDFAIHYTVYNGGVDDSYSSALKLTFYRGRFRNS